MTFLDDINRLFDELVRDPWSRERTTPARVRPPDSETLVELDVPVAEGRLGDVSVALQGRQLIVRTQRLPVDAGRAGAAGAAEPVERTMLLPEAAEVSAIDARITDAVLHVRVHLRTRARRG